MMRHVILFLERTKMLLAAHSECILLPTHLMGVDGGGLAPLAANLVHRLVILLKLH
jgi:hypothetical protein